MLEKQTDLKDFDFTKSVKKREFSYFKLLSLLMMVVPMMIFASYLGFGFANYLWNGTM